MATPFHGYTKKQPAAILQALGKDKLKREKDWPRLLSAITDVMYAAHQAAFHEEKPVYAGDARRRLAALTTALDAVIQAHEKLGEGLQAHLDDQLANVPLVKEGHSKEWRATVRCLLSSDQLPGVLNAVSVAATKAAKKSNPYSSNQETGVQKDNVVPQAVRELLGIFEAATGIPPRVYTSQHATDGYAGNFYKFAVACLAPVHIVHDKQLGSVILAAYKDWKRGQAYFAKQK